MSYGLLPQPCSRLRKIDVMNTRAAAADAKKAVGRYAAWAFSRGQMRQVMDGGVAQRCGGRGVV